MAVNYVINADVIDIKRDTPKFDDTFLVDTNVWYWMTYTRASQAERPPVNYQINAYPTYISNVLAAKSRLYRCGLSMAELAHLIEKTEREIFSRAHGIIKTKEYRHNHATERSNVVSEIQAAWGQVKTMAASMDVLVDEPTTDAALNRLNSQPLDGYDLFFLEGIAKAGVAHVITDDGDFASIPGIRIFTANKNIIDTARAQGKLVTR